MEIIFIFIALATGIIIGKFIFGKTGETQILKEELAKKDTLIAAKEQENKDLTAKCAGEQKQREIAESFNKERENAFKTIAQEVLEEKVKNFNEQAKTSFTPLQQDVKNFREKLEKLEEANKMGQVELKKEIGDVLNLNNTLQQQALDLTKAIKGDPTAKGAWGETTLKNILENAGLKSGIDFFEQSVQGAHRFDILLKLPNNNYLIIDSKTTFEHYMNYSSCQDEEQKKKFLKAHIDDIKNTIKDLSGKEYPKDIKDPNGETFRPDFTLMFVNPQSALECALKADNTLFNFAWKNNILLVCHDTLINTIEIVKKLWNIENQYAQMQDTIDLIKKMNNEFTYFLTSFAKVEESAKNCLETIKVARGHIDGNKGSLLPLVNQIQKTYHAPEISKDNARIIAKATYDYDGKGH